MHHTEGIIQKSAIIVRTPGTAVHLHTGKKGTRKGAAGGVPYLGAGALQWQEGPGGTEKDLRKHYSAQGQQEGLKISKSEATGLNK